VADTDYSGLSTSFWVMMFTRCLSGALCGNVAVVRAALADITDETNSTEAFALYGLTWTIGSIIGNAFGGTLSRPYERFPSLFGNLEIFRIHPYLLRECLSYGLS
jgi:MFS family permease